MAAFNLKLEPARRSALPAAQQGRTLYPARNAPGPGPVGAPGDLRLGPRAEGPDATDHHDDPGPPTHRRRMPGPRRVALARWRRRMRRIRQRNTRNRLPFVRVIEWTRLLVALMCAGTTSAVIPLDQHCPLARSFRWTSIQVVHSGGRHLVLTRNGFTIVLFHMSLSLRRRRAAATRLPFSARM